MKKNILNLFLEKLLAFPLWVKQVVFLRLYQDLAVLLSEDFMYTDEKDIFHLYVPTLSFKGRSELFEKKNGLDQNIYNFLASINDGFNMLEISLNNFWTMEEISKYCMLCMEQDYLKIPENPVIVAMAGFMAGKYRIGEFYKRSGKIDVDQLEKAIIIQREFSEKGNSKKMGEVLISLGYITEKDSKSLFLIKEEAKKRFILDSSIVPETTETYAKNEDAYKSEIKNLTEQNEVLKNKLKMLLDFIKKNAK